ncbi:MAG: hypothetical protein Q9198_004061, partial [Flavoplaca austrocitrina]
AIDPKTDNFGPVFDTSVMMIYLEDCPSEETAMRTSRLDFYLQRLRMQSLFVHVILKYLGNISAHLPFLIPHWPIDTPDRDPWATCKYITSFTSYHVPYQSKRIDGPRVDPQCPKFRSQKASLDSLLALLNRQTAAISGQHVPERLQRPRLQLWGEMVNLSGKASRSCTEMEWVDAAFARGITKT